MPSKILVVDDEPDIRTMIHDLLVRDGHIVVTYDRGDHLLDKVRSVGPDLILLDIMLPGADGYDSAAALSEDPELAGIPIIIVTALERSREFFNRFDQIKGFIYKPFRVEQLRALVNQALAHSSTKDAPAG
jgi:CheY-like chemotaxis protein